MRRKDQFSITVRRNTGNEFIKIREELGITNDELLAQMIELYRPVTWLFKILNRMAKWI